MQALKKARNILLILGFFCTSLIPAQAKAEVIFEGFYKVNLSGVHSGYAIQRYELDPKKKQFTSRYYVYLRLDPTGKKFTTESLVAVSNDKFHPVKYNYTAILEGQPLTIDAKYNRKAKKLQAVVTKKGQPERKNITVPKGSFLSTMLLYLVLQNGVSVGKNFSYNAIAEEDASVLPGTVSITSEVPYKGISSFKLEYKFKGVDSLAYISQSGHVLYSEAPLQRVSTELVTSASEATLNFPFPKKTLKTLFGGIPTGQKNTLSELKNKPKPNGATSPKSSDGPEKSKDQ